MRAGAGLAQPAGALPLGAVYHVVEQRMAERAVPDVEGR